MKLFTIAILGILLLSSGCTYYQVAPGTYASVPASKFDRAWSATIDALLDQGVSIHNKNRETGLVRGSRDGIDVTGSVKTQADGSIRVRFDTSGETDRDPQLIQRLSRSYNARMGR